MAVIVARPSLTCALVVPGLTQEWTRQLGTSSPESNYGVSADGLGNVYTSGYTEGSLGNPNAGKKDAFVAKYNAAGNLLWTRLLGTGSDEVSYDVSADGLGNVYASGYSAGSLGGANAGSYDAFLAKFDASGTSLWTRRIGTSTTDEARSISADGLGNVYISGLTSGNLVAGNAGDYDVFLSRYDASGSLIWVRQLGTSAWDESNGVSADGLGNVYISGTTGGSMGGANAGSDDAFLAKYSAAGNLLWVRQLGTSGLDGAYGVAADELGNVYISGQTRGNLAGTNLGSYDTFLAKYDASGNLAWTRQLGTENSDSNHGLSADGLGNVYLSGTTLGSLDGANAGNADTFVSKYNASGSLLWTRQFGTSKIEFGSDVSADGLSNVYVAGSTGGSLGGTFAGGDTDTFLVKFAEVPEPSAAALLTMGTMFALFVARRRPPAFVVRRFL